MDKMSNLYKGPSIDASYHLAEGFRRRRLKCEKLTDDGRRTPSDGKSSRVKPELQNTIMPGTETSNMTLKLIHYRKK
jgi:hypothetical protein